MALASIQPLGFTAEEIATIRNDYDEMISYEKGRSVTGDEGTFEAALDGEHGW